MTQALVSLSDSYFYPAPVLLQLADFKHVQASVFQVARAPGKTLVYLGAVLLIVGVFTMLYVRERRLWIWLQPAPDGGTRVQTALSTTRRTLDADAEFEQMKSEILQEDTMNSTTLAIGRPGLLTRPQRCSTGSSPLLVLAGAAFAFARYGASMDVYETWILAGAAPAVIALGWFWGRLRVLALAVGAAALLADRRCTRGPPTASAPTWRRPTTCSC